MLHKSREAMRNSRHRELFTGILEIDETYIGGKPSKIKTKIIINPKREKALRRLLSLALLTETIKKVHAEISYPNKKNKKLTDKQLLSILEKVADNNLVITDEFKGYSILDKDLRFFYEIINHSYKYSN